MILGTDIDYVKLKREVRASNMISGCRGRPDRQLLKLSGNSQRRARVSEGPSHCTSEVLRFQVNVMLDTRTRKGKRNECATFEMAQTVEVEDNQSANGELKTKTRQGKER